MKLKSLFCLTLVFMCTVDGPEERESESPLQSGVVSIPIGMISPKPILNTRCSGSSSDGYSSESHPQRSHSWLEDERMFLQALNRNFGQEERSNGELL
jgi:hypothetical protein